MPPRIILIRHGEAYHNATMNYDLPDPGLTDKGKEQCIQLEKWLREHLPLADEVEAIISSPMVRTLQTTLLSLDWLLKRGLEIEVDALWQENSSKPCDTGSDASKILKQFPLIDFTHLDPVYPSKALDTPYAFTREKVLGRGQTCLRNLYNRKEKVIAVVSHSGFLRTAVSRVKYANADYRVFTWREGSTGSGAISELVESPLTQGKAGMGRSEGGQAEVEPWDFPSEDVKQVKDSLGEQTNGEAANEVPP